MILNGSGFGVFANHSLVMANHVVRARDLTRQIAGQVAEAVDAGAVDSPEDNATVAPPVEDVERSEDADQPASTEATPSPESTGAPESTDDSTRDQAADGAEEASTADPQ
jgi:uncharacterized membrane protein